MCPCLRSSPSMWDSGDTTPRNESSPETVPAPGNLPPPSPVVMRYWKQCAGAEDDEEGEEEADNGEGRPDTHLEVSSLAAYAA